MWCWWCCHDFENPPLKLPFKYDDRRNIFKTMGKFCSWSCMKSFALEKFGLTRGGIICGNIVLMRKKMYNEVGSIEPAPSRFRLKEFGGDLDIHMFRKNQTIDMNVQINEVETEPYTNNVIPLVSNTKKLDEIKNSSITNNALKLKRNKPLKRVHNNLESALGLIITPKS